MQEDVEPRAEPGDLDAFLRAEHPRLVGALTLYVGDHHIAEQLAQDALVRACEHWSRVSGMEHPRAWLTRVAFNQAASWFRRRSAERRALRRHGPHPDRVSPPDTAGALVARRAVAELPTAR